MILDRFIRRLAPNCLDCAERRPAHHPDAGHPGAPSVYLRMKATGGNRFQFDVSSDGREWKTVGETAEGGYLPPWDRSVRVALTVGGVVGAEGRFNSFRITPRMNDK